MPVNLRNSSWWLDWLALGLSASDRETVLGDVQEAGESGARAFCSVAGLVLRRQMSLWRNWRPWLAAFGLAMPASFLLMGLSVSIAQTYQVVISRTVLEATGLN